VRAVRNVPDQTLTEFARGREAYEVEVAYLDETLWFVPNGRSAKSVEEMGVARGRIWTARELMDLASIPAAHRGDLQRIARLKAVFGAEIVEVRLDTSAVQGENDAAR
jgi:hypothetical protein